MAHFIGHHATRTSSDQHHSGRRSHMSHSNGDESSTFDYDDAFETGSRPSLLGEDRNEGPAALRVVHSDPSASKDDIARHSSSSETSLGIHDVRPSLDKRTSSAARLQAAGKKLTAARIISGGHGEWENLSPGIDPRRVDLPDLKAPVVIQAVEFSREEADFAVLDAASLPKYLERPKAQGAKVRWIHVNGLSWDSVKPLGIAFDLPPLAIEDMLHQSSVRSKVDYYPNHQFLNLIVHRLLDAEGELDDVSSDHPLSPKVKESLQAHGRHMGFHSRPRDEEEYVVESNEPRSRAGSGSSTPARPGSYLYYLNRLRHAFLHIQRPRHDEQRTLDPSSTGLKDRSRTKGGKRKRKSLNERAAARWTVAELTKDVKVHIHVEQVSVFLMRGGTIVSFTQDTGFHPQISQIFERISAPDDLIRESEECSMVLQAILDASGDDLLAIADEFRDQLTTLESHVLSNPSMGDVRHLHILSSQLLMLKSHITPFQYLLHALRSQDEAKAAAAARPAVSDGSDLGAKARGHRPPLYGFISHDAKTYLGDIIDHVDSVLASLDLFGDLAENLIAFTFNNLSYSSNSYMQALSVLSVIFLPLTFLSGYFGMNFQGDFPGLPGSVAYFWYIAVPVAVSTILIFGWTYLRDLAMRMRRSALRLYHRTTVEKQTKEE